MGGWDMLCVRNANPVQFLLVNWLNFIWDQSLKHFLEYDLCYESYLTLILQISRLFGRGLTVPQPSISPIITEELKIDFLIVNDELGKVKKINTYRNVIKVEITA